MTNIIKSFLSQAALVSAAWLAIGLPAQAQFTPTPATPAFPSVPSNISTTAGKPMLMLAASKDHTLFGPLFTDFEDLDGDDIPETTFLPAFKYYGYFDSTKCYTYSSGDGRFDPTSTAVISAGARPGRFVCGGTSLWSGNFLNWATMTRLDAVKKMLYGGQRFVDSPTQTILQMARLSQDSHSFVKYYNKDDINDYTPFTVTSLRKNRGTNGNNYAGLTICNRAKDDGNGMDGTPTMRMAIGNYRLWATQEGQGCVFNNRNFGPKASRYYGNAYAYTADPLIVPFGNGGVMHERDTPDNALDGARYGGLGPDLNVRVRVCDSKRLGEERCQAYGTVFKPFGLLQEFGAPLPGSGTLDAKSEFGLITGSYDTNLTGGALRKNMSDLTDEINKDTGQFCFLHNSNDNNCPTGNLPDDPTRTYTRAGAIKALDSIILYGRGGSYEGSDVQLPIELDNGELPAWGNPMGEMVIQALSYYANKGSKNPASKNDGSVGIPVATWGDPMSISNTTRNARYGKKPICRPLNVLAFSSSAMSFDDVDQDPVAKLWFPEFPNRGSRTLAQFTDAIGTAEGINGSVRSVGSVSGGFGESCAAKTVGVLSSVTGVCPDAPGIGGSYEIAGAALYANTNRVREVPSPEPKDFPKNALKVKTYAASLAGGAARIEVKIPKLVADNKPDKFVYITPESLWAANGGSKRMPGAMLTFLAIDSGPRHGSFVVTWNDSLFGGDYEMDIAGYLRYDVIDPPPGNRNAGYKIRVTTDIINVGAGWSGTHGFSIIGTNGLDGRYLTNQHTGGGGGTGVLDGALGHFCGIANFSGSTDLSTLTAATAGLPIPQFTGNGTLACATSSGGNDVHDRNSPVTSTFEMVGVENVLLREPLWYAAKYGSFTPDATNTTGMPQKQVEWDSKRNDGLKCGAGPTDLPCADGEPDGYFLARRPELLEKQLREALEQIITSTNSAPAVSSTELQTGGYKYVGSFDDGKKTGTMKGFKIDATGVFSELPTWDASVLLKDVVPLDRKIITNDGTAGQPFTVNAAASYSAAYLTALRGVDITTLPNPQRQPVIDRGNELIEYLRGDNSAEKPKPGAILRTRSEPRSMGTIVNSSPWLQARPLANWGTVADYTAFVAANASRDRLLWVGSNDGMLHGIHAEGDTKGGKSVISYVPSPLVGKLRTLASDLPQIEAGMDGSPFTADVRPTSSAWRTYLFSSLGRTSRSVFALDVTDPAALTPSNAGSIFKWMFSADNDADLGFVIGDYKLHPTSNQATPAVRLNNGKYAVLIPNGVRSQNGRAFLFILYVDGPGTGGNWSGRYMKLATDNLGGTGYDSNGLMGVNWADLDGNGTADVAYGTDFKGRLWKFNLTGAEGTWGSAFKNSGGTPIPMFEAMDGTKRLPVSTAPALSFPSIGGVMVAFGTGSAVDNPVAPGNFGPSGDATVQRLYSIYDRLDWTTPLRTLPSSEVLDPLKNSLLRRVRDKIDVLENGKTVTKTFIREGKVSFDPVGGVNGTGGPTGHDGWYIDFLPNATGSRNTSEMVISSPEVRQGTLFFTGVRPSVSSEAKCFETPEAFIYQTNPLTGTPTVGNFGTVTVNGLLVNVDGVASGGQKPAITQYTSDGGTKAQIKIVTSGDTQDLPEYMKIKRRQWREVPGMKTTN